VVDLEVAKIRGKLGAEITIFMQTEAIDYSILPRKVQPTASVSVHD
jgi:hypothetical protein